MTTCRALVERLRRDEARLGLSLTDPATRAAADAIEALLAERDALREENAALQKFLLDAALAINDQTKLCDALLREKERLRRFITEVSDDRAPCTESGYCPVPEMARQTLAGERNEDEG